MSESSPLETMQHEKAIDLGRRDTVGSITLTPEVFEKMYLAPKQAVKGDLRRTFANPTALPLLGLCLSIGPLSCDLMGWRGAGGVGSASIGAYYFLGGLLMFTGGILEFFLGNTFPFLLFCGYGGFWLTFAATLQPFYGAYGNYNPTDPAMGLDTSTFRHSFAFFLVFMCLFSAISFICSLRVNVFLATILFFLILTFGILAGAFFSPATAAHTTTLEIAGGATAFVTTLSAWYLFTALMLEAIDFPVQLPVLDLSTVVKARTTMKAKKNVTVETNGAEASKDEA